MARRCYITRCIALSGGRVTKESEKPEDGSGDSGLSPAGDGERRYTARRRVVERRGSLRWDPRAEERQRRCDIERRRRSYH
jgi:hypothetical protein